MSALGMRGLRKFWRVYTRMLKVHWAILLEYRGDTFFYMFGSFIYPLVTMAVWMAISAHGPVGSYDQRDFILYFLLTLFVTRLTSTWDAWEVEREMREGTLSSYLLRPSAYIHWRLTENLVYKFFYGVIMLVAWAIAWPFTPLVHLSLAPGHLLASMASVVLACALRYMLYFAIACTGFWTTRMTALTNLVEVLGLFLSGRIAPFALLPAWVRTSQDYTPFYWMLGYPVDLMMGKNTGISVGAGLSLQLFWTVLFTLLYLLRWHRGLKKYSAVGG